MPSPQEVDAMKRLMSNLSSINESSAPLSNGSRPSALTSSNPSSFATGRKLSDPDSQAMFEVLSRLNAVSDQTREAIAESNDIHSKQLAYTEETEKGVRIANYIVDITETEINGRTRNTYGVTEASTGKVMYTDLALYESVMAITKNLLKPSETAFKRCDLIAQLDADYSKNLHEAASHKVRIQSATDSERRAIHESKYSRNIGLAKEAKRSILKNF